jgi:hypothetical protein
MSYGFEFRRSDGQVYLDTTESAIRLVATVDVDRNFSGTISVPEFSINKGSFFLKPVLMSFNHDTGEVLDFNQDPLPANQYSANIWFTTGQYQRPDLSWDESQKQMTVTVGTKGTPNPEVPADFQIKFFHYI